MQDNQFELLKTLGYFSIQHLYLNFSCVSMLFSSTTQDDNPTKEDEKIAYTASNELIDISHRTVNQISSFLNSVHDLHPGDINYFSSLREGYSYIIKLGELLQIFFDDFFSGRSCEDTLTDYIEYSEIAHLAIMKLVNPNG